MLSKPFLRGLVALPLTCCVVDAIPTELHAVSRDVPLQNQAVLHADEIVDLPLLFKKRSSGTLRTYRLSVPGNYNSNSTQTWPLIIDFHGHGGDALGQWDNSQYYQYPSTSNNFFVAYPNGCVGTGTRGERAWQGAPYADPTCDDEQFVIDLIQDINDNYDSIVDNTRIYASGKSNGGGFVGTLACTTTGNVFAAFAMASAALYTDTIVHPEDCIGTRPRRILESHGITDSIIPINGTINGINPITDKPAQGDLPDIYQWARRWAQRNSCDPDKNHASIWPAWGLNTTYSCNAGTNVVQQYSVKGLGHCWPSTRDNTDIQKSSDKDPCQVVELDFTQAVINFFLG